MSTSTARMMFDHPAWVVTTGATGVRACRVDGSVWTVVCTAHDGGDGHVVDLARVTGQDTAPPVVDVRALNLSGALAGPLLAGGAVARLRNPDLWEALATSVVRQVIRAEQARTLHRRFCRTHGDRVDVGGVEAALFPAAEVVLALPDVEFERLGMKFFRRALRAAAEAYLTSADAWSALPAERLAARLQTVSRIGPWTAGATVADHSNDFALYPVADLAVRTWAAALTPSIPWPDGEREFAAVWRAAAGTHLSELTLLTLAHGARHLHAAPA